MTMDTDYLLARSEIEAVQSIAATDPRVAAVHEQLCFLYTTRALADLTGAGREDQR